MQRFLDPEGLRSRGIEHFDAWAATFGEVVDTMEISPDGASLAAPQPVRQVHQPARTAADVPGVRRRADGRDARPAAAAAWKAASRTVVACPMSEEQRALQQRAGRPLRAAPLAEGRPAGGQRPGHHHRRPQARPRRPAALGRRRRTSPARRSTPWSSNVADIWQTDRGDPRHADDLLRHGRATRRPGATRSTTSHRRSSSPRGIPREQIAAIGDADTDAKKQALFEKVRQRHGPGADRQHAEDGHRHQRAEAAGRPASPRRPVEAGRGRAARGPHPPAGQRERGSGDLPLRHRRIVRRLHVAGAGDQGPVHRARS